VSQTETNELVDENTAQSDAKQCKAFHTKTNAHYGDGIDDLKAEIANIAMQLETDEEEHNFSVNIVNQTLSKKNCFK
jgi:selenocysteine-specific translation elongation factor